MRLAGPAAALLAVLAGAEARAAPLSADRPGQANPPEVVGRGRLQIEGGVIVEGNGGIDVVGRPGSAGQGGELAVPELVLRLGVHRRVELQLEFDGYLHRWGDGDSSASGASDLVIGARVRLGDQRRWRPATGLQLGLSVPTGADAFTSDGFDPSLALLYQWDFAGGLSLNGNFDFGAPSQGPDESGRYFEFEPSLAFGVAFTDRLGTFVEYFGAIRSGGTEDAHAFDGGFTWLATDDVQLDVSAGIGVGDSSPGFFVGAGVVWRLPPLWM